MTSSAQNSEPEFDVAIVGYGPAGAVAAALLGQAGLKVFVCDKLSGVYEIPRAISLDHEVMRLFQQLGIVDAVAPFTEAFTPSEWFGAQGQLIRRMTMVPPPYPQGYTPSMVFTQPAVERVIRDRVAQWPNVTVALGVQLVDLVQGEHDVVLTLKSTALSGGDVSGLAVGSNSTSSDMTEAGDGASSPVGVPNSPSPARTVRARWAIACDGGGSTVRGLLGVELDDLDFDQPWLVVDLRVNEGGLAKLPKTSVQFCEPQRPCTLVIGPGNHRRWEISLLPGEDLQHASTPERTWQLLSRWLTPQDATLWRQSSYRFHALVAKQWRVGRVFLAGDAAHMQPPFLGQGMCQGLRDVANLTWKLTAVLKAQVQGAGSEALLDSYGTERSAHVRTLTGRLKAAGAIICERDPAKAQARDERLLAECGGVVKDTPRQDVLPRLETGLLASTDTTGRGTLFPQPRLMGTTGLTGQGRLMDASLGYGWRLVLAPLAGDQAAALRATAANAAAAATAATAASAASEQRAWRSAGALKVLDLHDPATAETEGVVAAWMQRHACNAALLRPDHCVFGTAATPAELENLLAEAGAALS
jgi:3-(3-hydroxy-phenyl)propionate hydroxylase